MVVKLQRHGGFAGIPRQFCVDTAKLANGKGAEIESIVADIAQHPPAPATEGPDRFTYVLQTDADPKDYSEDTRLNKLFQLISSNA